MSIGAYSVGDFPMPLEYRGIYCKNVLSLYRNTFIVCAVFTPNRNEYYKQAQRLAEYCEKLGREMSEKTALNNHRIYRDKSCTAVLENFLEKTIGENSLNL
jgi:hypothetical protein